MQRRRLMQLGLGAGAFVALAGGGVALWRPGLKDARLTPSGQAVFGAVSRAVLGPLLAEAQLPAQLARIESAVQAMPAHVQAELAQLLALLAAPPTRLALTGLGDDWASAPTADVLAMLERLRQSPLQLRRQVYQALRDLTNAAWFANPASWRAIGYPGPRSLAA